MMNINEQFSMSLFGFSFLIILALAALMLSVLSKNKARKGVGLIALAVVVQVFFHGSVIDISINGHEWINLDSVIFTIGILIQIIGLSLILLYGSLLGNKKRQVARQRYEATKQAATSTVNEDVSPEIKVDSDEIQVPSFLIKRVPAPVHRPTLKERIFGIRSRKINPKEC